LGTKGWLRIRCTSSTTDFALSFKDNAKSVVEDVQRIRNHPLVPNHIPIHGYIYDCKTGKLLEVPDAANAGKVIN